MVDQRPRSHQGLPRRQAVGEVGAGQDQSITIVGETAILEFPEETVLVVSWIVVVVVAGATAVVVLVEETLGAVLVVVTVVVALVDFLF